MTLFRDLGNRPLVVIRFNPDKNKENKGCFQTTPKTQQFSLVKKEWNRRTKILKECIDQHITNVPEKEITFEYMFYN